MNPNSDLNGKRVGFIVRTRHNRLKPLIGIPIDSPGDDDSFVNVVHVHPDKATVEEALTVLREAGSYVDRIFTAPIPSGSPHWLLELTAAEKVPQTE